MTYEVARSVSSFLCVLASRMKPFVTQAVRILANNVLTYLDIRILIFSNINKNKALTECDADVLLLKRYFVKE